MQNRPSQSAVREDGPENHLILHGSNTVFWFHGGCEWSSGLQYTCMMQAAKPWNPASAISEDMQSLLDLSDASN
jgi:hypothetical protein